MSTLGVIGGSGLNAFQGAELVTTHTIDTPYGVPSAVLSEYSWKGNRFFFLPRHGDGHHIPPHKINYRANITAFKEVGVGYVLGCNAVGAIHPEMEPGHLVIPEQIIDYSYGREHTFADGSGDQVDHIDFTNPFDPAFRQLLIQQLQHQGLSFSGFGTYGCTQGPRLESAAEVRRLQRDGCDLIGMTAMPEASLAREAGLQYASLCIVANWAAGLSSEPLSLAAIHAVLNQSVAELPSLILSAVEQLAITDKPCIV